MGTSNQSERQLAKQREQSDEARRKQAAEDQETVDKAARKAEEREKTERAGRLEPSALPDQEKAEERASRTMGGRGSAAATRKEGSGRD